MPDALVAGALAGLAALSLPLGAVLAVLLRPSPRIVAVVMAFGSGALIHAVVTELAVDPAQSLVAVHQIAPIQVWLVLAAGFLAGGLLYVGLNMAVERMGGGLHWRHRLRRKALRDKREQAAPVLLALSRSRLASCLSPDEAEAMLPFMRPIHAAPGQPVFSPGDPSHGLYVVVSGDFEVHHEQANGTSPSGSPRRVDAGSATATPLLAVTRMEPGAVVGGLGMAGGETRTETLVAPGGGELLFLAAADIDHLAERVPCFRKIVADIVARELFVSAQEAGVADPEEWHRLAVASIEHLTSAEVHAAAERHGKESSPLSIFIGTLQDGIPESLAIGASFAGLATFSPTFMVAVFLSNLPEGVAGTSALLKAKFTITKVLAMWVGLVLGSVLAGFLGYELLHDASPVLVAGLGALAGGGVVAMLAMTMMPEAYESGHAGVAPATIIGFLASLLLAVVEMGARATGH
jgi:CRP-like cAMP-binding protein